MRSLQRLNTAVSPKQYRKKGSHDAFSLGFSKGCGGYFSQQATNSFSRRLASLKKFWGRSHA